MGQKLPEQKQARTGDGHKQLDEAIAEARLNQHARFDAVREYLDSQTLRLEVLRLELADIVRDRREADGFIDLKLVAGDKPRLWIDMTAYVVMEPTPRHFRLVQDRRDSHAILFETDQREKMVSFVTSYIANRLVERDRALSPAIPYQQTSPQKQVERYSSAALILAWLSGFVLGVMGLFLFGIWYAG